MWCGVAWRGGMEMSGGVINCVCGVTVCLILYFALRCVCIICGVVMWWRGVVYHLWCAFVSSTQKWDTCVPSHPPHPPTSRSLPPLLLQPPLPSPSPPPPPSRPSPSPPPPSLPPPANEGSGRIQVRVLVKLRVRVSVRARGRLRVRPRLRVRVRMKT